MKRKSLLDSDYGLAYGITAPIVLLTTLMGSVVMGLSDLLLLGGLATLSNVAAIPMAFLYKYLFIK